MDDLMQAVCETFQQGQNEKHHWQITPIPTGVNGLVYRARSEQGDLAVKISKRDERDRAGREYAALTALLDFEVAPRPIAVYRDVEGLPGDVLISSWVEGQVLSEAPLPADQETWRLLSKTLAKAHQLTPTTTPCSLKPSVWDVRHPIHIAEIIRERYYPQIPDTKVGLVSRDEIEQILTCITRQQPLQWEPETRIGLILCDCNPANIIRTAEGLRLVDWENSGWADPAFDIGDMAAQQRYFEVPSEHWDWFFEEHARNLADPALPVRAETYRKLMLVFWLLAMTKGLAQSGVKRLEGVHAYSPEHYARYQQLYLERLQLVL